MSLRILPFFFIDVIASRAAFNYYHETYRLHNNQCDDDYEGRELEQCIIGDSLESYQ